MYWPKYVSLFHFPCSPNLYSDGKVCLSLLGTWAGPGWQPGKSTVLQVLLSIQAMILGVEEPYGNEPGWGGNFLSTPAGRAASADYNRTQRWNTLRHAVLEALHAPTPGFEDAIKLHFSVKAEEVKAQAKTWAQDALQYFNSKKIAGPPRSSDGSGVNRETLTWQTVANDVAAALDALVV
jgi:hypothetical protein